MTGPEADSGARAQRMLALRASIKLLVVVGIVFLLVPFVRSLPWPTSGLPADATLVPVAGFAPGETRGVTLRDGSLVLVTRASPPLARQLHDLPEDRLWFPSAPGLAGQDWFVVSARSALDEAVRYQPPQGTWPGGLIADSGAAWDVAGRALKPEPGNPGGYARKVQNLLPLPWRERDGQLVLVPVPPPAAVPP